MKFLVDRCAGRQLAEWLRQQGHDVVESRDRGTDPGDRALLQWAASERRVLVTIDTDFGTLIFLENLPQCGLLRLPDVPIGQRVALVEQALERHGADLQSGAIVTVRGGRIRIARPPAQPPDSRSN